MIDAQHMDADSADAMASEAGLLSAIAVTDPPFAPDTTAAWRRSSVGDYGAPMAILAAALVAAWWLWKRVHHSPRRDLARSVRRARRVNEQVSASRLPHPVPEMEAARRSDDLRGPDRFAPAYRYFDDAYESEDEATELDGGVLDERSGEALIRLRALVETMDPKDVFTDYRRLDAFVRRYVFEFYGVKAFGQSAASVLESLPDGTTDDVFDYAGEILRLCELAELPRHRPSLSELRRMHELAADMVLSRGSRPFPD